jgi:hypothetical protein
MMSGFLGMLLNMERWNNDPDQKQLVDRFIAEARGAANTDLISFIIRQNWSARETRNRIAHALSLVKQAAEPAVYKKAKNLGLTLMRPSEHCYRANVNSC